jgi:hypothetical protein
MSGLGNASLGNMGVSGGRADLSSSSKTKTNNPGPESDITKSDPHIYNEFKNEKNKDDNMMAEKGEEKRVPEHWQANYK